MHVVLPHLVGTWEVTDWVLEIFFDWSRLRSSMFMKSMLPPKLS